MDDAHGRRWTFLTNHGHVMVCLARAPDLRLRDVAEKVGVTERAVQRIVADLEEGGFLIRHRHGRQNEYEIDADRPLRHAVEADSSVGVLLGQLQERRPGLPRRKRVGAEAGKKARAKSLANARRPGRS